MFEEPFNVREPATKHSYAVQLIVKMSLAHVSVSQFEGLPLSCQRVLVIKILYLIPLGWYPLHE